MERIERGLKECKTASDVIALLEIVKFDVLMNMMDPKEFLKMMKEKYNDE